MHGPMLCHRRAGWRQRARPCDVATSDSSLLDASPIASRALIIRVT